MKKSLQYLNFLICFGKVLWSQQSCSEVCLPDDLNVIKLTIKTRHFRYTITSPMFIHTSPVFFLPLQFRVKLIPPEQASILGVHRTSCLKSWFLDTDGSFFFFSQSLRMRIFHSVHHRIVIGPIPLSGPKLVYLFHSGW